MGKVLVKFLPVTILLTLVACNNVKDTINIDHGDAITYHMPKTKEVTLTVEGVEQKEVFKLINFETMPFVTYVPEDCIVKEENGMVSINWRDFGFMEIFFYSEDVNESEVLEYVNSLKEFYSQYEDETDNSNWLLAYRLADDSMAGFIFAGEHNGRLFTVYRYLNNLEILDEFESRLDVIYREWLWKDSGLSFQYPHI